MLNSPVEQRNGRKWFYNGITVIKRLGFQHKEIQYIAK